MRLRDLISEFDGFVIDQYGVLHDGVRAYAGAIAALEAIRAAGKRAVLMTNSGKSAAANEERLARLGFARELYAALVSSGEAARLGMRGQRVRTRLRPGRQGACHRPDRRDYGLDRFPLQPVDLAVADALLILGSDAPRVSLDEYSERLKPAAARNLPALCANPDLLMLTKSGQQPAPGAIARVYETLGGKVVIRRQAACLHLHDRVARLGRRRTAPHPRRRRQPAARRGGRGEGGLRDGAGQDRPQRRSRRRRAPARSPVSARLRARRAVKGCCGSARPASNSASSPTRMTTSLATGRDVSRRDNRSRRSRHQSAAT